MAAYFNTAAYDFPANGFFGDLSRNSIIGPILPPVSPCGAQPQGAR